MVTQRSATRLACGHSGLLKILLHPNLDLVISFLDFHGCCHFLISDQHHPGSTLLAYI